MVVCSLSAVICVVDSLNSYSKITRSGDRLEIFLSFTIKLGFLGHLGLVY